MSGTVNSISEQRSFNRLKVLFITASYPTKENPVRGVFIREHAKAVQNYDDVCVLYLRGIQPGIKDLWRLEKDDFESAQTGIPTYHVWYKRLPIPNSTLLTYVYSAWRATLAIEKLGFTPHIIHAHIYKAGVPAVFIGKIKYFPVIITEHETVFPRNLINKKEIRKAKFAFSSADAVLPVSKALLGGIMNHNIHANFQIIPNAVDTRIFHPPKQESYPRELIRLLYVGSLLPRKGVSFLLEALAQLKMKREDWCLDILGDGPNRDEYKNLSAELGLSEKVTFHGYKPKEEIAAVMRRAQLFILPSLWENLPCVLIEAIASGLPILSTQAGGIPEIVDEEIGMLVPAGNVKELSLGLTEMLSKLQTYDRSEIASRSKRYSLETIGREIHNIYKEFTQA